MVTEWNEAFSADQLCQCGISSNILENLPPSSGTDNVDEGKDSLQNIGNWFHTDMADCPRSLYMSF